MSCSIHYEQPWKATPQKKASNGNEPSESVLSHHAQDAKILAHVTPLRRTQVMISILSKPPPKKKRTLSHYIWTPQNPPKKKTTTKSQLSPGPLSAPLFKSKDKGLPRASHLLPVEYAGRQRRIAPGRQGILEVLRLAGAAGGNDRKGTSGLHLPGLPMRCPMATFSRGVPVKVRRRIQELNPGRMRCPSLVQIF